MNLQDACDWTRLRDLCRTLRSPGGCAWDRAQTPRTLTPYLLEETHELLEAIADGDDRATAEELGDLLYLIVFLITMAEEEGRFGFEEVAGGIIGKLIRRHPHVFAGAPAARAAWEKIKRAEAANKLGGDPAVDIPDRLDAGARGLPALIDAFRVQEKAADYGFDWPGVDGVLAKLAEEQGELRQALEAGDAEQSHAEAGDLLFTLVNLARHLRGDPEQILRRTTRKFRERFRRMEAILAREGRSLESADLPAMEAAWQQAKRAER